ncbi:LLM class F420-dependent oxidoreductase [Pseudonocardia spinosispora]|uniref:LLM class F420-dependent oxidoreductase n=1 Tax=Pseudonocardia spinosispora TaxID=103441 RepID=UPI00040B7953|nr:LLM class F420-dependent oxidoreductase [Pseudonocardia spinosispora]
MSLGVVTPFWLDRPDREAVDIAVAADRAGFDTLWIGEMATFDAFALATAVGLATERIRLKVGPLAVGVRGPVAVALGAYSVAQLTGRPVELALGASSPAIVSGWHDRPFPHAASRMREFVRALRPALAGDRVEFAGEHVRTRGFRLRGPLEAVPVTIAAYGPAMTRVAAEEADEIVLNLVTPEHVTAVRDVVAEHASRIGRPPPGIAVWIPAAVDPGQATRRQLAAQLAVYLAPPGYGEMFTALGYGSLVTRARAGTSRAALADDVPLDLVASVGAVGSIEAVVERIDEYHRAGADHVGIVPATAQDPAGAALLEALAQARR